MQTAVSLNTLKGGDHLGQLGIDERCY